MSCNAKMVIIKNVSNKNLHIQNKEECPVTYHIVWEGFL